MQSRKIKIPLPPDPSGLFGRKEVVEFLVPDFPLPFPGEEAEAEELYLKR
jgi:hypothetical protein